MAAGDQSNVGLTTMIDETYEFSAPRFFDFVNGESEESQRRAELWFETALSCAPSPCMPGIKTGRSINVESLCDFTEVEKMHKTVEVLNSDKKEDPKSQTEFKSSESKEEGVKKEQSLSVVNAIPNENETIEDGKTESSCPKKNGGFIVPINTETTCNAADIPPAVNEGSSNVANQKNTDAYTTNSTSSTREEHLAKSKKQMAKKIGSLVRNPSAMKPASQLLSSQAKNKKSSTLKGDIGLQNVAATANLTQENQAIKRQKLEEGRSRQILNIKPHNLLHKSKPGLNSCASSSIINKTNKEDRKIYVQVLATPFVSTAEMMQKFQSSTRDLSLPHVNINMKPKLTLTRPKEPELETAQRVRSVKVKSTAELEEDMMAKMPKYKPIPLNKRILKAPTFPAIPRSKPQMPEFQEFHFKTATRANQAAESASVASTDLPHQQQNNKWKLHLSEPKPPVLHTLLRARPPRVKSSSELEQEELEKRPKFTARPLNKKIFESKGEMGLFKNPKKNVTKPEEFHFATDERIPYPTTVADLFNKLAISSEPHSENPIPKRTKPNPFHLCTEERGAEKETRFFTELNRKEIEEERARIPKAKPYPYTRKLAISSEPHSENPIPKRTKPNSFHLCTEESGAEKETRIFTELIRKEIEEERARIPKAKPYTTDYPVILTKPEPKHCTKSEPFQLKSLVRHEEEMQRELEEKQMREKEEAEMRIFKAQPILKEDPIPLPEKVRKPLTQVQTFNLRADLRALEREEYDQKVKEKELKYKRYRDESEAARMVEEEKELKQMRKTMVPHARPVPNFGHPFLPQKSSKQTTKAKSPNLRVLRRKETRKMIRSAISSAAAHMR